MSKRQETVFWHSTKGCNFQQKNTIGQNESDWCWSAHCHTAWAPIGHQKCFHEGNLYFHFSFSWLQPLSWVEWDRCRLWLKGFPWSPQELISSVLVLTKNWQKGIFAALDVHQATLQCIQGSIFHHSWGHNVLSAAVASLGTGQVTKTDEFLEEFQKGGGGSFPIQNFILDIFANINGKGILTKIHPFW